MTTTVINIKSGQPYDIYVGRANATYGLPASKWGNPFKLEKEQDRAIVLARYRIWLLSQPELLAALPELRGLRLACWCSPKLCHGDVLAELADGRYGEQPVIDWPARKARAMAWHPGKHGLNNPPYVYEEAKR